MHKLSVQRPSNANINIENYSGDKVLGDKTEQTQGDKVLGDKLFIQTSSKDKRKADDSVALSENENPFEMVLSNLAAMFRI